MSEAAPIWDYSRKRAQHTWWDEGTASLFTITATPRGYGSQQRPKIDGYDLKRIPDGKKPVQIAHGTSVKALKAKAVEVANQLKRK